MYVVFSSFDNAIACFAVKESADHFVSSVEGSYSRFYPNLVDDEWVQSDFVDYVSFENCPF